MHFTNFDAGRTLRLIPLALLTVLPFAAVSMAGDPYQPVRAILSACAVAVLLLTVRVRPAVRGRIALATGIALTVLLAAAFASAMLASPASALFGVHGRFQGLLTIVLFALAGVAGVVGGVTGSGVRLMGRVAAFALVGQAALVLWQRVSHADPTGTMGNAVLAAGWLAVLSALVAGFAIVERGRWRVVAIAAAALGTAALGATATRGAWVALLVAGTVALLLARRRAAVLVPLAFVGMLVGALLLGGPAVVSKLNAGDLSVGSAASRFEIWKATAAMIADHPLLGVGPGRFLYEYPAYQTADHARIEGGDTRADQAHGAIMHIAAEAGLPGAAALVMLAGLVLAAGVRGARRGDAVSLAATIALSAFVAQAAFGISTVETDSLAWFLGGILVARGARLTDSHVRRRARVDAAATPAPTSAGATYAGIGLVRTAGVLALGCALAAVWYLSADIAYQRGTDAFAQARFGAAMEAGQIAIERNPLVDIYRVAYADAAAYAAMTGDTGATDRALERVNAGLELEPRSYDLAASRARLLARSASATAPDVWRAYQDAFALYPRGVNIRTEAYNWAQTSAPQTIQEQARDELARVTQGIDLGIAR
ncbi:MAG: O-antigen ligase family protein [Coriobacteriia bacterium]